ncbi:hypothetical protein SAMN04487851_11459 [Prevotella sp. tc2-28]|uniref:hypothetical protein n=1 Tax=Prevotella sp. tc2-28 TaxID=1761888 RepID=UPI0008988557|nr:hypothetical protein [Prevotella sp. tc2-28]SEA79631.1 hypothetical protein SAMN04487851_11459 [Prevotella sp. tc2-28]
MEEKKKRFRPSLTAYRALESELRNVQSKLETAESTNKFLESCVKSLEEEKEVKSKIIEELRFNITMLRERGFWARVFNK